jgi:hypothetical protein
MSNQNNQQQQDMTDEEFLLAIQQLAGQAPIDDTSTSQGDK